MERQIEAVVLQVKEEAGIGRVAWPLTRGVPLPEGAVRKIEALSLKDKAGEELAIQTRALARWPDGSLKWALVDFQSDLGA